MQNDQIINRVNVVIKYFSDLRDNNLLPTEPIKLSAHTTIIDVRNFYPTQSHAFIKIGLI